MTNEQTFHEISRLKKLLLKSVDDECWTNAEETLKEITAIRDDFFRS